MNAYLKCSKRCVQSFFIFIFTEFIYKDFINKMKEMNKTYSLDQLFLGRWNNINRWVIVPAGLPLHLHEDGLYQRLLKAVLVY